MTEISRVSEIAAVITRFVPKADCSDTELHAHMVKLMLTGARFAGFFSADIHAPVVSGGQWKCVQRFATVEDSAAWSRSKICKELLDNLSAHCDEAEIELVEDLIKADSAGVTTAIVTEVRPGMEDDYFAWQEKISLAQAKCKGYRGMYMQPPGHGKKPQWATLLHFDSPASLQNWFDSPERHDLVAESEKFIKVRQIQHTPSSFPGWVGVDATTGESAANWKTAMLVLMGLFPVVTLEMRYLNPFLTSLPQTVAAFVSMTGSVAATTFVTMPFFVKNFRWWLFPKGDDRQAVNLKGLVIVCAIYLAEVMVFSHF